MFRTKVTEMFGIQYPIIGGAMQWLSRAELVSAISNAGGLGILSSLTLDSLEELREEIKKTRSMTDKPFAVNVTLMPTIREINYEEYFTAIVEEGVKIIETAGRPPEPACIRMMKNADVKVMHKVAAVRHVKAAERMGMDAVSIVGFEAGGHPGMLDVTSLVQIPLAVDSVKIPVIGGGGIADARGFVAALALGAEGVLMGTRFMASKESGIHPKIKEWLVQATETDTQMIERSIKNAARVMRTDYSQKVLEMEGEGASLEELLPLISGGAERKALLETGDVNSAVIHCGQAVGSVHEIPSVMEIIENIISEAKIITQRLYNL